MAAEQTAKLAFGSIFERGFDVDSICEWMQSGARNSKNRRFLNVVLTTSVYVNGCRANRQAGVLLDFGTSF